MFLFFFFFSSQFGKDFRNVGVVQRCAARRLYTIWRLYFPYKYALYSYHNSHSASSNNKHSQSVQQGIKVTLCITGGMCGAIYRRVLSYRYIEEKQSRLIAFFTAKSQQRFSDSVASRRHIVNITPRLASNG